MARLRLTGYGAPVRPAGAGAAFAVAAFLVAGGALAVGGVGAGCLFPSEADYLGDRERPALGLVDTDPGYGAEGVSRTPVIRFWFDQRVDPDSLGAETLALVTGPAAVRSSRRVDLIGCAVELRPQAALRADLTYRATVRDLVSVAGGALEAPAEVVFVTGDGTATEPVPAAPTLETLVTEVFAPRCGACHGGFRPAAGLDLSTPEAARATLVRQDSSYHPGYRRVVPGSSATSYLLWKLLDLPGIWGSPMPPPEAPGWPSDRGCGTQDPDLRRIAAWVDTLPTADATP